jgi:hypothetical protein
MARVRMIPMSHANTAPRREISALDEASAAARLDVLRQRLALRERPAPDARPAVTPLPGIGRRTWIADLFAG